MTRSIIYDNRKRGTRMAEQNPDNLVAEWLGQPHPEHGFPEGLHATAWKINMATGELGHGTIDISQPLAYGTGDVVRAALDARYGVGAGSAQGSYSGEADEDLTPIYQANGWPLPVSLTAINDVRHLVGAVDLVRAEVARLRALEPPDPAPPAKPPAQPPMPPAQPPTPAPQPDKGSITVVPPFSPQEPNPFSAANAWLGRVPFSELKIAFPHAWPLYAYVDAMGGEAEALKLWLLHLDANPGAPAFEVLKAKYGSM
jgi:hypothetical protein